jgi:hypothetical protein
MMAANDPVPEEPCGICQKANTPGRSVEIAALIAYWHSDRLPAGGTSNNSFHTRIGTENVFICEQCVADGTAREIRSEWKALKWCWMIFPALALLVWAFSPYLPGIVLGLSVILGGGACFILLIFTLVTSGKSLNVKRSQDEYADKKAASLVPQKKQDWQKHHDPSSVVYRAYTLFTLGPVVLDTTEKAQEATRDNLIFVPASRISRDKVHHEFGGRTWYIHPRGLSE